MSIGVRRIFVENALESNLGRVGLTWNVFDPGQEKYTLDQTGYSLCQRLQNGTALFQYQIRSLAFLKWLQFVIKQLLTIIKSKNGFYINIIPSREQTPYIPLQARAQSLDWDCKSSFYPVAGPSMPWNDKLLIHRLTWRSSQLNCASCYKSL